MFEPGQTFAQFLDDYYAVGPSGYLQYTGTAAPGDLKKILVSTEANWLEYQYMQNVQLMLSVNTEIYKLLDKIPITTFGDSFKYSTAFNVELTAQESNETDTIFGTPTEPAIATIQGIASGIERTILNRTLHEMVREKMPDAHKGGADWDFLKNTVAPQALWGKIDNWLGGYNGTTTHGVDNPALANIECIDRMISNGVESADSTDYVSTETDGDIYWDGQGTVANGKIDRSAVAFADAQVTLPGTANKAAGKAYNIMEELDDLMAAAKKYSENKRYIGLTTDKTLNLIEGELSPGYRYLEKTVNVAATIGGISTRPGHTGGFDVGAVVLCGVTVPVFTSNALPTKNVKCGTGTETAGHFYLIDLDGMFIRVDIPVTYLETGFGAEMIPVNYWESRAVLFTLCQLVCTNFQSQAALKWIAA